MKVAFTTIGCKLNQFETMAMREALEGVGFQTVPFAPGAQVYIVNTCTVTHRSDYKGRQMVRRAAKMRPSGGIVIATGCQAQLRPKELISAGADLVIGNTEKARISSIVKDALRGKATGIMVSPIGSVRAFQHTPLRSFPGYSRAFLKVQDGCDNRCTYCTVWMARGPARSAHPLWVIKEAEKLVASGYKELILTGVHLGAYRWRDWDLARLLEALLEIEGLERIRLSSIEPREFTPRLKVLISSEGRIAPHLHIPMQSGDNRILNLMGRRYTREYFAHLVRELSRRREGLGIGVDVIVGFPGEDEKAFRNTLSLLEDLPISYMHIFTFSPRPNTPAAQMEGQIPPEVKEERYEILRNLRQEKMLSFRRSHIGRLINVLIEGRRDKTTGLLQGISENYIPFLFLSEPQAKRGEYVTVLAESIIEERLAGKVLSRSELQRNI